MLLVTFHSAKPGIDNVLLLRHHANTLPNYGLRSSHES
jgi:hypothetical protein